MENKEVRKVITFEAIRDILFSNMPYLNDVIEKITGIDMVELDKKEHPYFIAGQFHPELKSRPNKPAPLFVGLVKACLI